MAASLNWWEDKELLALREAWESGESVEPQVEESRPTDTSLSLAAPVAEPVLTPQRQTPTDDLSADLDWWDDEEMVKESKRVEKELGVITAPAGSMRPDIDRGLVDEGVAGAQRGMAQTAGMLYGFTGMLAEGLGMEPTAEWANKKALEKLEDAQQFAASIEDPYEEIEDASDTLKFAVGAMTQFIPDAAVSLLAGGLGGLGARAAVGSAVKSAVQGTLSKRLATNLVTRQVDKLIKPLAEGGKNLTRAAAEKAVADQVTKRFMRQGLADSTIKRSALGGAYAVNYAQNAGEISTGILQQTGETSPGIAALAAAPNAALDTIFDAVVGGPILGKLVPGARAPKIAPGTGLADITVGPQTRLGRLGQTAQTMATTGLVGGVVEGVTEGAQTAGEQLARGFADPRTTPMEAVSSEEAARERSIAAAYGFAGGLGLGAAGGVAQSQFTQRTQRALQTKLRMDQAEAQVRAAEQERLTKLGEGWDDPVDIGNGVLVARRNDGSFAAFNLPEDQARGLQPAVLPNGQKIHIFVDDFELGLSPGNAASSLANLARQAYGKRAPVVGGQAEFDFMAGLPKDEGDGDYNPPADAEGATPPGGTPPGPGDGQGELDFTTPPPVGPAPQNISSPGTSGQRSGPVAAGSVISPTQDGPAAPPAGPAPAPAGPTPSGPAPAAPSVKSELDLETRDTKQAARAKETLKRPVETAAPFVEGLNKGDRVSVVMPNPRNRKTTLVPGIFAERLEDGDSIFQLEDGQTVQIPKTQSNRVSMLRPEDVKPAKPVAKVIKDQLGPAPTKAKIEQTFGVSNYTPGQTLKQTIADGNGDSPIPVLARLLKKKGTENDYLVENEGEFTNDPLTSVRQMNAGLPIYLPENQDLNLLSPDIEVTPVDLNGVTRNKVSAVNLWGRTYRQGAETSDFSVSRGPESGLSENQTRGLGIFNSIYRLSPERLRRSAAGMQAARTRQQGTRMKPEEMNKGLENLDPVDRLILEDSATRAINYINRKSSTKGQATTEDVQDAARFAATDDIMTGLVKAAAARNEKLPATSAPVARRVLNNFNEILGQPLPAGEERDAKSDAKKAGDLVVGELQNEGMAEAEARAAVDPIVRRLATVQSPISIAEAALKSATKTTIRREANRAAATADLQEGTVGETPTVKKPRKSARPLNAKESAKVETMTQRRDRLSEEDLDLITADISGEELTGIDAARVEQIKEYLDGNTEYETLYPQRPDNADAARGQTSGRTVSGPTESRARGSSGGRKKGRAVGVGRANDGESGTVPGAAAQQAGGSGVRDTAGLSAAEQRSRALGARRFLIERFLRLTGAEIAAATEAQINRVYEAITTILSPDAANQGRRVVAFTEGQQVADLANTRPEDLLAAVGSERIEGQKGRKRAEMVRRLAAEMFRAGAFESTTDLLEFIANNKSLPRDMQLRAKAALGLQTRGFNWANIATQIGIFRNMDGSRTTWAGLLGKDRDGGKSIAINLDNGHDRGTAYQTFLHEIQHVLNDAKWDAYYGLPGGQGLKLNKVELAAIKRIEDFWKRAVLTAAKQFGIDTPANPTDAEFTQLGEQIYELSDPTRKDIRPDRRLAALRNPRELSVEITSSPETAELLAELGFGKADKEGRVAIKGAVKEAWDALVQLESGTIADPDSPLAMAFKASMAINFAGTGDKKVDARYTVPDSTPSRLTRELDEMRTASDFVEAELEARGLPGTSEQRAQIVREYELTRREPTQEDLDEIADPETMSRAADPSDLIQIGMRVRVTARDANGTRFNFFARPGTGSTMLGAPVRVFQETDKDGATVNRTRVVQADLIENEQPLAMSKTYGEWVPVPSTSLESRAIVDSWQRAVDQNRLGAVEFERLTADEIPQSTQEVYKLVVLQPTKPMQAQSLFDRPENAPKKAFPVGEWIRAEVGRPMISGPLAMRPGFHAIGLPIFDQGRVQAKGQMRVWASVTMPAFTDSTQQEADSSPILANGMRQGIKDRLIGPDEAYNYKTNPNAEEGGTWPISGSMKINRFLTNTEITEILTGAAKEGAVANNISNFTDDQVEQINRMVVRATESRATTPQENLNTTPQMVSNRRQANEITSRATADGPGNLEPRRQTGDRGMGPDDAGRADRPGRPQLRADAYLAWLGEQARTSPDLLRNPQRAMLAWGEAAGLIQTPEQVRSRTTGSRDQGAFEHHVYDTVDGKILKVLKPGRGYSYDPLEYLVRLSRLQTAVPDLDIDVTGMLSVNRSPRFVTEMARIAGEHPDAAFLSDKLAEYGWADTGNFTYLHRSGVSMTDAAPDNFIRVGDDVVPFDVIFEGDVSQPMFVPSQEQVAESRAVSETLPPVPTDPMPMSAVDVLYRDSAVLPKPAKKIKNAEVATILADIAQRYWGFQLNSENITPEIEQIIVANGVEEFISALRASGKNAADWYSTAIEVAMEVAGVIHPEITNAELARGIPAFSSAAAPDKAAQLVMRIALAVTSQNLNVNQNAGYAEEQYAIFRRTGKFDSSKIYGEKAESISGNLELANQLIAKLGFEGAEAFIQKEFSVDTLQKEASAVLGRRVKIAGKKDDIVNGAALFGPKIGQGFLQNLMGRFNPVTIDLWMRRTWGRWTGDVVGDGVTDERMAKLLDAAREDGLQIPESLRSLRTVERKRKNGESYKTMSSTVADRLETDPDFRSSVEKFAAEFNSRGQAEYRFTGQPVSPRVAASVAAGNIPYKQFIRDQQRVRDGLDRTWDRLRKEGKKPAMSKASWVAEQHRQEGRTEVLDRKVRSDLKPRWSRSAKVIIGNLNPIDIPSPQDRRVITRIVNKIREDLSNRGYSATNADVQAVLWYPEKDLWAKLRGEEESNLKLSYDDEFISIAEERGLGEQARAVASRIRADRAARTGGQDDAGTDRGVARPADASPATDQRVESRAKPDVERNKLVTPDGTVSGPTLYSIAAWHTSPYKYDRVDLSKVGTGEGATVYGWGFYLAENPEVSGDGGAYQLQFQRDFESGKRPRVTIDGRAVSAANLTDFVDTLSSRTYNTLVEYFTMKNGGSMKRYVDRVGRQDWDAAFAEGVILNEPQIYRIEVDVESDQLLDWDNPVSEEVARKIYDITQGRVSPAPFQTSADGEPIFVQGRRLSGREVYELVGVSLDKRTPAQVAIRGREEQKRIASEALLAAGIPGIRYLDQGSRQFDFNDWRLLELESELGSKEAAVDQFMRSVYNTPAVKERMRNTFLKNFPKRTYNYVIFDENLIKITERNGQPVSLEQAAREQAAREQATESRAVRDPIVAAAVREQDGRIFTGPLHTNAIESSRAAGYPRRGQYPANDYGFVTETGRFLNAEEARDHAIAQRQITREALDQVERELGIADTPGGLESGAFALAQAATREQATESRAVSPTMPEVNITPEAARQLGLVGPLYHGSPDFKGRKFTRGYLGRNTGLSRSGVSFTDDLSAAMGYALEPMDEAQAAVDSANDVMREVADEMRRGLLVRDPVNEGRLLEDPSELPEFNVRYLDDMDEFIAYADYIANSLPANLRDKLKAAARQANERPNPIVAEVYLRNPREVTDVNGKKLWLVENPDDIFVASVEPATESRATYQDITYDPRLLAAQARSEGFELVYHGDRNQPLNESYSTWTRANLPLWTAFDPANADWFGEARPLFVRATKVAGYNDMIAAALAAGIEGEYGDPAEPTRIPEVSKHSPYEGTNENDLLYIPKVREELNRQGFDAVRLFDQLERDEVDVLVVIGSPDQVVDPLARSDIRQSRAVADPDDEDLAAAEVLNNGRPVDTYGLPRGERASDTTPEGDLDVADAQIDSTTRSLVKLVGAFESATDKLRRGTGLTKLAGYIDNYFDLYEQRLGLANGLLRRARVKMGMGSDEEAVRTFESYMRARENKRAADAKKIYDQSTEAQRAYIDAWEEYSKQTGAINTQIRTPDGKPMQVYDTKLKKWRPIQTVRDFFPRTMRQEVQAVLQNPALDPALYNDLLDSLVAGKKAESREQAQEYLKREYFGTDTSQDYFAGVERGRREPLPEIFYDYSVDAIRRYMKKWAQRTAQIEAFGQATSQGTGDWFDNNITKVRDQNTRRYLNQIKERIYEVKEDDAFGSLMNWLNVGATGLQLGNPATAFINLFGGSGLTVTEYGWKNTIKAAKDVFSDWKNVMQSGADLGIVGKDLLNVLNDADMEGSKYFTEQSTVSQALAKFASFTMKWGGYSGAENFVRATTMLAARGKLMEGLRANNTNPSSSKARWVFDFAKRENLDANKLVMENGAGPETGKFLRKAVNVPQGSYRIDMTPIYVDQPLGRFLFKYQKFGTQLTRMFWRHHLQPFIEKPDLANFSRLLHFFSAAIASGTVIVAGRAALFGYPDPGPDEEDLKRALANKDTARAWGLIFSRAWHSMNAAGALGFFGNYFQFVLDWRDQQRVKNPLKPPGLASIDAVVEVLSRLREQGKLTGKDIDEIAESTIALYRANKRIGLSSLDAVGIEFNQVKEWAAEKQIRRMRKYSRMYADDREIEGRQRSPDGRVSKTPMSPLNRDITLALRRGDAAQAKLIMDTALKGAATKEEREAMMASIQSSVRYRQPLSISGRPPSSEERADFFNWARRNAPPHRYESMRKMDEEYRRAAARLGVSIK